MDRKDKRTENVCTYGVARLQLPIVSYVYRAIRTAELHFLWGGRRDVRSQHLALSLVIGTPWLYNGIIMTTPGPHTNDAAYVRGPALGWRGRLSVHMLLNMLQSPARES